MNHAQIMNMMVETARATIRDAERSEGDPRIIAKRSAQVAALALVELNALDVAQDHGEQCVVGMLPGPARRRSRPLPHMRMEQCSGRIQLNGQRVGTDAEAGGNSCLKRCQKLWMFEHSEVDSD